MCRFYGWTDDYVESLSVQTFLEYWHAINVIEAREKLVEINALMMPHVDDKARTKFYKELEKQAYPMKQSKGKKLTNKELAEILARR
jgi:hypothetical protein